MNCQLLLDNFACQCLLLLSCSRVSPGDTLLKTNRNILNKNPKTGYARIGYNVMNHERSMGKITRFIET